MYINADNIKLVGLKNYIENHLDYRQPLKANYHWQIDSNGNLRGVGPWDEDYIAAHRIKGDPEEWAHELNRVTRLRRGKLVETDVLKDFVPITSENKIAAIKHVRDVLALSLRESKEFVEGGDGQPAPTFHPYVGVPDLEEHGHFSGKPAKVFHRSVAETLCLETGKATEVYVPTEWGVLFSDTAKEFQVYPLVPSKHELYWDGYGLGRVSQYRPRSVYLFIGREQEVNNMQSCMVHAGKLAVAAFKQQLITQLS